MIYSVKKGRKKMTECKESKDIYKINPIIIAGTIGEATAYYKNLPENSSEKLEMAAMFMSLRKTINKFCEEEKLPN